MDTPARPPTVPLNYFKNLEKLGADAASSDYTIACSGSEFKVHKQVVSLHSEYFARLFESQYKESSINRVDLVEDPKAAVESMVQYFYKFDYATAHIETTESSDPDVVLNNLTSSNATPSPDTQLSSDLQSHADIYTLADKYDVTGLKTLAKTKFESLACLLAASAASPSAHLLADVRALAREDEDRDEYEEDLRDRRAAREGRRNARAGAMSRANMPP